MTALKYSRQRESIKSFLLSRYDHPTADTIYMNVRKEFPNISLGTVYRNLALLTDLGEIIKITTDGADRFDAHVEPHSHFICRGCHEVLDIQMEDEDFIDEEAQKKFSGRIEGHTVQYFGLCEGCLAKKDAISEQARA
ncbi:MAG: transcriptional repressor [Lachnospiraceae bacterium]|nr:transcriptional repressor [Lachnospiraceae bacterium]